MTSRDEADLPHTLPAKRRQQRKRSSDEYSLLLRQLGEYFQSVYPSDVSDRRILEAEVLLGELERKYSQQSCSAEVQDTIDNLLGSAGFMSDFIKRQLPRTPAFFATVRPLGRALIQVSMMISSET